MRVSYQHANVRSGNESTLLRFTTRDGTRACVLVDCGADVDLDSLLGDDEYLNAILLTHGHIDHYRTLARNVRHNAPIYASPATATVLEHALPEARKDNDIGDTSSALDALEPIEDWTSILHDLEVRPVPVGHTPGGAGFVIRFRDAAVADDLLNGEGHLLATGDFTRRPCAGYPGLTTTYPFDIDAVLLNVSTADACPAALDESVRTVLERAYAGARVVVATSSLTGVHYATLLGHAAAALDRDLPITLVGQTAKLYDALGLDEPGIETRGVFDRTAEMLEEGRVTIAGPETPTRGSASRLFDAVADDPAAVFVQLATDDAAAVSGARCTTHCIELRNHPSIETIDDTVRELAPTQVVIKHAMGETLNRFQRRFDRCFTWGTNDQEIHRLYEDGEWLAPDWIAESTATQIRTRQWEAMGNRAFDAVETVPAVRRESVDLEAEGLDLEALETAFAGGSPDPYAMPTAADESTATETATDAEERDAGDQSLEAELLDRLAAIEAKLEQPDEETVRARVLSDGDGEQFLRLVDRADVDAGDTVEITISSRTPSQ
ncbi:MBL fold metallo-hydrolase [Natrinema sp. 1APR25-10V2]|uniref:MBL fold metallo-hydrolase n=1 Tax=Natrinema sp. 1APR25-10V2 TaxID=2951081 RepID=UPI002876148F|nr:MBL fold metallo-hydrolase [Natrinema sp. 1APR25-10V2]MDS0474205.1 MBL fold metallo-hydrolase [Natrinema sp. 1APR25-10V2]